MEPTEARFNLDFGDDTVCSQRSSMTSQHTEPSVQLDSEDEEVDVVNTDNSICNSSLSVIDFDDR